MAAGPLLVEGALKITVFSVIFCLRVASTLCEEFALQCVDEGFPGTVPVLICALSPRAPSPTCLHHPELPDKSLLVLFQLEPTWS